MIRQVVLVGLLLVANQCGYGGGDRGGDGNPATGACEYSFEETTVDGVHHRYPYLYLPSERAVYGKVLFFCQRPPLSHHAVAELQTRRSGAGQDWRTVRREEMWRLPNPRDSLFLPGHCDPRTVAHWRIHLKIDGRTRDFAIDVDDYSAENRIECP